MVEAAYENVHGAPSAEIVEIAPDATQFSPLFPGARDLADVPPGSLDGLVVRLVGFVDVGHDPAFLGVDPAVASSYAL